MLYNTHRNAVLTLSFYMTRSDNATAKQPKILFIAHRWTIQRNINRICAAYALKPLLWYPVTKNTRARIAIAEHKKTATTNRLMPSGTYNWTHHFPTQSIGMWTNANWAESKIRRHKLTCHGRKLHILLRPSTIPSTVHFASSLFLTHSSSSSSSSWNVLILKLC